MHWDYFADVGAVSFVDVFDPLACREHQVEFVEFVLVVGDPAVGVEPGDGADSVFHWVLNNFWDVAPKSDAEGNVGLDMF